MRMQANKIVCRMVAVMEAIGLDDDTVASAQKSRSREGERQMTANKLLASILCAFVLVASQASAAIIFSDDFSSGTSGTGFTDVWNAGTISGGVITVSGAQSYRYVSSTMSAGTNFWFVCNLTVSGNASKWGGLNFYSGTTEKNFFGTGTGNYVWKINKPIATFSTVTNFTGVASKLVMHFTSTSIDMWIDPPSTSSEGALGSADASFSGNADFGSWNRVRIATDTTVTIVVDDMIAATTFNEALNIPPQGTLISFL
jgi:hypothetical protein